ncbi:MAG: DNA gyrase subunit A [Nitrospirae bacterium]|nr:DNA gyrase subunit A [Nitrospirota bacterium]
MQTQERKIPINIEDEMKTSYLDYAMSVIVGRALPDVRDGLKPVQRRILYAMFREGLLSGKKYSKCAGVVGEVLKKYHPHGDMAVYDALVRLAQDFNMRYPLIDGQGNFGSVDGDPPAAYRYTEARLMKIAEEMLADIDKETVEYVPNFDGNTEEPTILPTKIPNLMINGSSGIAVGMATNIPPHNLGEVVNGLITMIDDPEVTIQELMKAVKGPDFPTAGIIYGLEGIHNAYTHGRGLIQVRAKAYIEKEPRTEKESIIITELPYQVNKARLIENIAELIRDKKIEGIGDLRDESDREGMRIVLELKKGELSPVILNQLYKHTQMQSTFGVIMLTLVNNQPRVLNLKKLLSAFLQHRREVVFRRTTYDLRKAEEKAHILEGLRIALENIDRVIALIKASKTPEEAREGLIEKFKLTSIQAQAILDMKLQRLTGLEREKIMEEYKDTLKTIESLKAILGSEALLMKIIRDELLEIKKDYANERRTEIVPEEKEINIEDLIAEEEMVITISHRGYIKRNLLSLYRSQKRGGRGVTGMETKEEDFVEQLFTAMTHDHILFFTDKGKVHRLKVYQIPEAGRTAKGKAIVNLLNLDSEEKITNILPVKEFSEGLYLLMVTSNGIIKKTALNAYSNPRAGGIIAITLDEGNNLIDVKLTDGDQDIVLSAKNGLSIRFKEKEVREIGRAGKGVKGINLKKEDQLVSAETILNEDVALLTVTEKGFGKRTPISDYPIQGRSGKGVITIKTTERNGKVIGIAQISDEDEVMMVTAEGKIIRVKVKGIPIMGRNTQGVKLIEMDPGDKLVSITKVVEKEE